MRKKRLIWNTISSLGLQIVILVCGFILPRLILHYFGSEVNGLVNSIAQFLGVISLMEFGMGAVMQSSLYEPLANHDEYMVSCVVKSGKRFFRNIGLLLFVYITMLLLIYPKMIHQSVGEMYVILLILVMSIDLFAKYYLGITNQILLSADQRAYICNCVQMGSIIINTFVCTFLMMKGFSIHIVKLSTSVIYLIRPIALSVYVRKKYHIDRKIIYDEEPIRQKWNGVAQHAAAFILNGTDTIVLTMFAALTDVSIYAVYNMVILGVKNIFVSLSGGIQSIFGEMLAKREIRQLTEFFGQVEWIMHVVVTFIFGCTAVLVVPFIKVYTKGVNDAVYNVPVFAILLTLGNAMNCLRLPYNMLILAGGHYKQTQSNYIIAALMNILISIALVKRSGLIGVAIGTLAALSYQTIWMAYYDSKNLIKYPFKRFVKQICTDVLAFYVSFFITQTFEMKIDTYTAWLMLAVKTGFVWFTVILAVNVFFYFDNVKYVAKRALKRYQ